MFTKIPGADPNRQGRVTVEGKQSWSIAPLQLALQDQPDQGRPFNPFLAVLLLEAGMHKFSLMLLTNFFRFFLKMYFHINF